VIQNLKGARVEAGALVEGSGDDDAEAGNAGTWIDLNIMMEEYLDGPEVDVDLVLSQGEVKYGAITDNWPTVEPYFNETGSNCPSILPRNQQMELLDLGIKAVQCMGFELGVFHVELKYTSHGARLIEVNARMGGGPVRDTNLLVWGVDLVEQHITSCCGIPCQPPVSQKPLRELAELTINAKVCICLISRRFHNSLKLKPSSMIGSCNKAAAPSCKLGLLLFGCGQLVEL
jgi:biotin carboxylase